MTDADKVQMLTRENAQLKEALGEMRAGAREVRELFAVGRVHTGLLGLDELGEEPMDGEDAAKS